MLYKGNALREGCAAWLHVSGRGAGLACIHAYWGGESDAWVGAHCTLKNTLAHPYSKCSMTVFMCS